MVIPALMAIFLTRSEAIDRVPAVTQVLQAVSDGKRSQAALDSPVAEAVQGGKNIAIDFERGRRTSLGQMKIPAIGLKTKFYDGVVDEAVKLGPGHWPGTPWPGQRGNSVFAGHRTTHTRPFGDLDLLQPGDRIHIGMRNASPTTYRVVRTLIVPEAEYAKAVLKQPRHKRVRLITLFACTPKGSLSHRIIVQAKADPEGGSKKRGSKEVER
ncbi:MAG: class E sortase [Actinomycetota bacterium]